MRWVCLALLAFAAGCGGDPIPMTELKGTLGGTAFQAKSAVGHTSTTTPGARLVIIRDGEADCAAGGEVGDGDRAVTGDVPWITGTGYALSPSHYLTFVRYPMQALVTDGEVLVFEAPTGIGNKGTLLIKATAPDDGMGGKTDSVAGRVDVVLCD